MSSTSLLRSPFPPVDILKVLLSVLGIVWPAVSAAVKINHRVNRLFESDKPAMAIAFADRMYIRAEYEFGFATRFYWLCRLHGIGRAVWLLLENSVQGRCKDYDGIEKRVIRGIWHERQLAERASVRRRFYDDPALVMAILQGTARV